MSYSSQLSKSNTLRAFLRSVACREKHMRIHQALFENLGLRISKIAYILHRNFAKLSQSRPSWAWPNLPAIVGLRTDITIPGSAGFRRGSLRLIMIFMFYRYRGTEQRKIIPRNNGKLKLSLHVSGLIIRLFMSTLAITSYLKTF